MTMNDIYKCSNIDAETSFIIDKDNAEGAYGGKWFDIPNDIQETEIKFFSITKTGKKNGLPYAKEVFVALAE